MFFNLFNYTLNSQLSDRISSGTFVLVVIAQYRISLIKHTTSNKRPTPLPRKRRNWKKYFNIFSAPHFTMISVADTYPAIQVLCISSKIVYKFEKNNVVTPYLNAILALYLYFF